MIQEKRGPGRPRKTKPPPTSTSSDVGHVETRNNERNPQGSKAPIIHGEPIVKRKRGRPRKNPEEQTVKRTKKEKNDIRRSARQLKIKTSELESRREEVKSKTGVKRGRPSFAELVAREAAITQPAERIQETSDTTVPKKKRGRPPGSSKTHSQKAKYISRKISIRDIASPTRYSPPPIRLIPSPGTNTETPVTVKPKRGRPSLAELAARKAADQRDSSEIPARSSDSSGRNVRKSPASSGPGRHYKSEPLQFPPVSLSNAIGQITALYERLPETLLPKFHYISIQAMHRLIETKSEFTRADSPRE